MNGVHTINVRYTYIKICERDIGNYVLLSTYLLKKLFLSITNLIGKVQSY